MSLVHESSLECLKNELDLFDIIPTQASFEKAYFNKYFPVTTLERGGPVDFTVWSMWSI